jgi:VanZ family protein
MFTELEQHFIPSRSMELGDFLADAAGAALGFVAFTMWAQRRREFSR